MTRFEKLNLIREDLNPRFPFVDEIDIDYRFDITAPPIIDTTTYGPRTYYKGNKLIKRKNVQVNWTDEMKSELYKCKSDILYFAERYFYIRTLDHGKILVPLRDYQKFWLRVSELQEVRNRIWLACRQSAKSSTMTIELLHKMLFLKDYEIALLANKGTTAREILGRVRLAYEMLPFWFQNGVDEWNKGSVALENGNKIFAGSSRSDSVRGLTPNEILLDEMCFIRNDEEFMNSTYPAISSGKNSRVTMISTPNGPSGVFYNNWRKAQKGENSYFSFKVPWFFVPGRDEEWKKKTIEDTSFTQFRQEQDVQFIGKKDGFLSADAIEEISKTLQNPLVLNSPELSDEGFEVFEVPVEGHSYVATVDTAEGKGKDASTITMFDVTKRPFKQVLTYQNSEISPLLFPFKIAQVCRLYNNALCVIENNSLGALVAKSVYLEIEYENTFCSNRTDVTGIGVRATATVKGLGCSVLRTLIEKGQLQIRSDKTLKELSNFVPSGGSFGAVKGEHDDLVANLWLFAWLTSKDEFADKFASGSLVTEMYQEDIEQIIKMQISIGERAPVGNRNAKQNGFW